METKGNQVEEIGRLKNSSDGNGIEEETDSMEKMRLEFEMEMEMEKPKRQATGMSPFGGSLEIGSQ